MLCLCDLMRYVFFFECMCTHGLPFFVCLTLLNVLATSGNRCGARFSLTLSVLKESRVF